MKFKSVKHLATFLLAILWLNTFTQEIDKEIKSSKFYVYWGWNRAWFTDSDIKFSGDNYNFSLLDVKAKDRQTDFAFDPYFNPLKFTIPQYNFKIGYQFSKNVDFSLGIDHMKYVVENNQQAVINGFIDLNSTFDGNYSYDSITLSEKFLKLEHTDGLNYVNFEIRNSGSIVKFKNWHIQHSEGLGLGIMIPKTNASLMGMNRHDDFHFSGYGINGLVGLKVLFKEKYFVQIEGKSGFIHMPNVRTTNSESDRANQHFFYIQQNIVFGGFLSLNKKE
ncbi:MAG: hypothetical protein P8L23_04995 [Flavobacteriales bacterium]|nr:hypothetical protein [Flavobacteriales bacterium]